MPNFLLNLFFPQRCLGCGRWGSYLCPDCLNFIRLIDEPVCPLCQRPSPAGLTHPSCRQSWGLAGLTSIFAYQGIVKQAIIKLKYRFVTDLAETILELFLSFCGEDRGLTKFVSQEGVYLVPIPLHWQRHNWRGFNQAELLGQMIADGLGIGFIPDLLMRHKKTKPQSKLDKETRAKNIQGAFAINKKTLKLSNSKTLKLLLFDDVWTSGATLKEAGQVLKRNGVKQVWGLTLARKE